MKTRWYKDAVVYQIYPFSFKDSNNDGWGDIEGIISKLDYIKNLGVTAIWFSPLYDSPDKDYGYDIRNYKDIDLKFGTMADFDRLLSECHKRDLKVIMDMVLNHTSTDHPWFKDAISSPNSKYRDYYIIRPGVKKRNKLLPPTNWTSSFTGSAWERISGTEEFYLHLFCKEQADLNWENPAVRREVVDILNFWLEKGVDGFRFDVFNMFSKVYPLRDDKKIGAQVGNKYFVDGPKMHEFLQEINVKALSHFDSYTVGESYTPTPQACIQYVNEDNKELDTIFNFEHLTADNIGGLKFFPKPFNLKQYKKGFFAPQNLYYGKGWNTLVLENHDVPRSVCRFGIDYKHYRYEAATFLATITFLGFGIPFIYMGEEIGMTNADFKKIDELMDPVSHFVYDLLRKFKLPKFIAFKFIKNGARDHARVPMQWDGSINGGFNAGAKPWQRMNSNYAEINAEKDLASKESIYRFYQELLALKKTNTTFIYGKTVEYEHEHKQIIAYSREYKNEKFYVVGNFSKKPVQYVLPEEYTGYHSIFGNYETVKLSTTLTLRPYEAIVLGL